MKIINPQINLDVFFQKLHVAPSSLLILDYDGTLAPFTDQPNKAFPYPGVRERIQKIMQNGSTNVVILSGRALDGLKGLLQITPPPELWGSHGGERLKQNSNHPILSPVDQPIAELIRRAATEAAANAPELICEVKPLSVAIHWRNKEPKLANSLISKWKKLAIDQPIELHEFDGGIEFRPKGINKGVAVETLLLEMPLSIPVAYLGDDFTDEEAFEALGDRGLKVLVKKQFRPTKADLMITPPDELNSFLERWCI
jgi:trehalose 6-phosphate phosphatase